ncbi:MAG: PAS domain S-box protein [Halobacteriales archaeon]
MTVGSGNSPESMGSLHILHVDDDPDFVEMVATFLQRKDPRYCVETATGVREGHDQLADGDFDCIVSDYDMPQRTGIEFLTAVREDYPDLPFILFTGKGSEEIASEAISAGVTDYLQKGTGTDQYTVLANRIENAVDQYRSRRALEASQKRLSLFIDQSPLGVIEWDDTFDCVRLNDAAEEILGYAQAELKGRSWKSIVPESDRDAVNEVVADLLENKGGYHSINENVRKDGDRIICEWHNRVVTDEEGKTIAIFSQFQDITERKEREQQLRRTSARLEALFDNSPDMINIHDAEGNLIAPNPQLCEQTSYTEAELTDMKVWELDQAIGPDEAKALWAEMEIGDTHRLEGRYQRRDGSTFPVEVHIRRLDLEGEDRFVVISRDISARKERERELERQNERLEEFASALSHDLRNPLNVAEGNLELAKSEGEIHYFDKVAKAHDRMAVLIDDLLSLAREGEPVTEFEPIELTDVIESCWQNVATADATIRIDADVRITGDRIRLKQLLENLLRNAIEHGGDDVQVTVGVLKTGDGFYLEDSGPGIPPDERAEVFESGYSTSETGTGFGLAIVEEIVDAHGWEIRATDSPDGGARFEISGVDVINHRQ